MNYGNYGRDLLLELQNRSGDDTTVPAYNDTLVSATVLDLALHVQALNDQVKAVTTAASATAAKSVHVRPSIMLQTAAIQRNKRCLLTYHWVRLQRLQQAYYWNETSENTDPVGIATLAPAEQEFLREYRQLQARYNASVPVDDLRAHATNPPLTNDRVLVRVGIMTEQQQQDGPIVLESGQTVHLQTGATHFLLWSDVEDMVRAGILTILGEQEEHV
jgi:hypothetical protein